MKPELDEMVINTPVDHDALDGCVKSFIDLYDLNPMLYVIDHYEN